MSIDDLHVYSRSLKLAVQVREHVREWSHYEKETLGIQLVRAAVSVPANIAEGYGRLSPGDKKRFMSISLGSLLEMRSHLSLAMHTPSIDHPTTAELLNETEQLIKMLTAFARSIQRN